MLYNLLYLFLWCFPSWPTVLFGGTSDYDGELSISVFFFKTFWPEGTCNMLIIIIRASVVA